MTLSPDIDIILPCFNPSPGWDSVVQERLEALRQKIPGKQIRAILVNDGSDYLKTHASLAEIESKVNNLLLLSYPHNKGKGFALRTGIQRSIAPVIVYTDIDFPYTIESMLNIINPVLHGEADVTIAVRNQTYYDQLPVVRRWMSGFLRFLNKSLLHLHTSDTQGGLKAFGQNVQETFLQTQINRYLFDLEFIYLISRKHLRIRGVETDLREGITMSPVRLKIIFRESWNFLQVLLKK